MNLLVLVLLTFFAVELISCGPSKYKLEGGKEQKGDSYRNEMKISMKDGSITFSTLQNTISGKVNSINHSIQKRTTLETDDNGASFIEVFHEKGSKVFTVYMNGKQETEEEASPLQGVTVLRRRNADGWTETIKGNSPTPEQGKLLDKKARNVPSLYPDRELIVGETWTVSAEALKRLFGDDMLSLDGKMHCTFVRIEELEGHRCAVILVELDATGTGLDQNNNEVKVTMSMHGTTYRSLKRLVDLKSVMRGNMKWEGKTVDQGQTISMTIIGPAVIEEYTTILK
jgi:hypothetical protein